MLLTITIPGRPPSLNSMYVTSKCGRYRFLSKEATTYKSYAQRTLRGLSFEYNKKENALDLEMYVYLRNVTTKKGAISEKSGDLDGFFKGPIDCLFKALKIDDSAICKITAFKLEAEEEKVVMILRTMPLSDVTANLTRLQ